MLKSKYDNMDDAVREPEEPEETTEESGGEPQNEHTLFISPEHLGGLDPATVKPGDILEFKVVGTDSDGDIEVEYNKGGDTGSGMDKIGNDFRSHMMGGEGA